MLNMLSAYIAYQEVTNQMFAGIEGVFRDPQNDLLSVILGRNGGAIYIGLIDRWGPCGCFMHIC